ncbi:MAG TPA: hypothetical protein VJP58_02280 [Candidatus Nitrosocosmicus sp.]|nr:hypothetical protein [Candidatus Nitrosocosmicus sp.]
MIYGLSTEGYEIAKKILRKQSKVIIIDENSRLGVILTSEIVKEYPHISFLNEEELLLNLEPFDKAISNAPIVFFAPRIRKVNQDVKNEIISKFKDIITYLRKNTVIVINVPLGIGGNNEIITLIEHQSGLMVGTDVTYYYYPINSDKTSEIILGSHQQRNENLFSNNIFDLINENNYIQKDSKLVSITSAELVYSINIINKYSNLACINEISKLGKSGEDKREIFFKNMESIYFDEIANGLFDLRIIGLSISSSTALSYVVNGTIRSIEGFIKNLVDETRSQLKYREIKASRTKVTIFWTIDNHEIRGDKTIIRELLESKLRDYIAEVEIEDIESYIPNPTNNIIIACSNSDYKRIVDRIEKNINHRHPNYKLVIVAANSTFNTMEL